MKKATRRSPDANVTPATRVLAGADVVFALHRFDHDPRATDYGQEAVRALGVDAAQVFKTLVLSSGDGADFGGLLVAVLPVQCQLDLRLAACALGVPRAQLADPSLASRVTGYVVGGISPLGQRHRLATVLDGAARTQERIFVSAGRRGMEVEVAPGDLIRILDAVVAPVTRVAAADPPTGY